MKIMKFQISDDIWKNKNIPIEAKYIYTYIYAKGSEQIITNINIGELQQTIKIKNEGLRNNLQILEKFKYLIFKEYDKGMYTIHLTNS